MEVGPSLGPGALGAVQDSLYKRTSYAFTAADRLLRSVGYDHVLKAESVGNQYVKIFFVPNGKRNGRLGIISSKRVFPFASQRNLVKRTIREVFRKHEIRLKGVDLVVIPRKAEYGVSKKSELEMFFGRIQDRCVDS